jgi:hypothetical protein
MSKGRSHGKVPSASSGMDPQFIGMKYLEDLCWDTPKSHVILRERHHGSRSIAAVMAYTLAGVGTVRGAPARRGAVGSKLPVSRRQCSSCRNTLSGQRRPR